MSYITKQELIDRFGESEMAELTDRINAAVIDDAVLDTAIADADATIDGYLSQGGYTLPLPSVPALLKVHAVDLARYRLYDDCAPDQIVNRYKDAMACLKLIAEGKLQLGLDSGGGEVRPDNMPEFNESGNVFDRSDKSFI